MSATWVIATQELRDGFRNRWALGSIALLAASAEIEAGRYDLACVLGVEQMKTVNAKIGGDFLGTAAWYAQAARPDQPCGGEWFWGGRHSSPKHMAVA